MRQAATLLTGTVAAQAVPLLASPVLTRIYGPTEFGAWTLYSSVVLTVSALASLRYDLAIMLPAEDAEAELLAKLSLRIGAFVGLIVTAISVIFSDQLLEWLQAPGLGPLLPLAGVNILALAFYQTYAHWANRQQDYRGLATARIVQAASVSPLQILIGFLGPGMNGLVMGTFAGHVVSTLYLRMRTVKKRRAARAPGRALRILRRYWRMPLLNGPHAFLDAVKLSGLNLMIGIWYGQAALGQYGLAWRTALVPAALINGALVQIYYQRFSTTLPGRMVKTVLKLSAFSASVGIIPFFALAVLGDPIFALVFGEEWHVAGQVAQKLAPWLFLSFVTGPLARVFIVTNTQGWALAWALVAAAVPIGVVVIYPGDLMAMLNVLVAVMSALMLALMAIVLMAARKFDRGEAGGEHVEAQNT